MSGARYQRLLEWFDRVFFGGVELSVLSTPAFVAVVLTQWRYPDAAALAGLLAIAAGSLAVAVFRCGAVDVGEWPRRGELTSLPVRVGYFSLVFFVATMGVAAVAVTVGTLWLTLLGGVVQATGLAAFPTVYRTVYGDPVGTSARRV
jgi:hypothetical protein